jgi:OTU-like cysteine protease
MARVVPQAGDGSCLFHSLSFGIKDGSNACTLRREICAYIQQHPQTTICETPLSEWVKWDSGVTCTEYARKMKNGAWGGGIEMAIMSALKLCNVHVYEMKMGSYKRISAFDHPVTPELKKIVRVLYRGGVHYDALVTMV